MARSYFPELGAPALGLMALGAATVMVAFTRPADAGTFTFTPTADAQVLSDTPSYNYGKTTRLSADGSPAQQVLMRFSVANLSGTVTSAKLRVYVNNPSGDGPLVQRTMGAWSETAVTWNTRPALTGNPIADRGAIATATWVEYDVTSAITADGVHDLALVSKSADGATFHSRETVERPQLVVVTQDAPTEPTPTPTPTEPTPTPTPTTGTTVDVTLQPRSGVSGTQRVNFAVPLPRGLVLDPDQVRVLASGVELRAARRELALHPDGSVRSIQLQVDTTVAAGKILQIRLNEAPTTTPLALVAASTTLEPADGTQGPRVWVRLPAAWLAASGVTGPQVTEASVEGTALDAFDRACDYANHTVTEFLSLQASRDVWLYDRGTTMYRAYARRGDQLTLESAYRETSIYRAGITGTGTSTRISVPTAADDLKYHYTQNLAIHFLLTGDDRFREAAENISARVAAMWRPAYTGAFWTERHAGFALLAHVWARIVTDDQGATLESRAKTAFDAYMTMQATVPSSWTDPAARCFAHTADSAGESFGTTGCSPWMSAIVADALDQYATETGGTTASTARAAIVKLGKILARDGRDGTGKPYYWMGLGSAPDEVDPYHEHWGEPAYVVAMAWFHGGKTDSTLKTAALQMLAGLKTYGSSPHMRSFNWQCRSAIAAPYYLK